MYDYIIKHGTVMDGTGAKAYKADVAIKDGKIISVSENICGEGKIIDAAGLVVAPGFIDSHSHSDNAMLLWPDQIEKVEQGITLAVAGQCGTTNAPVAKDITPENADDVPGFGKETDVYRTMGTLLDIARNIPQGSGQAVFVGHRALRMAVCGPDYRDPTSEEMARMKELLIEGMEHGAMGVSFGLIYAPSCYAKLDELVELARTAKAHGGIISAHIRNEGPQLIESVAEFIEILRLSGARGILSHHKAASRENWGKVNKTLEMIDDSVKEGIEIYLDVYPYTASHTTLSTTLIPKEYHSRGLAGLIEYLNDSEKRGEIKAAGRLKWQEDLSWVLISACSAYPEYVGKRLDEIAKLRGTDMYDAAFDMIRDSRNNCSACYFTMCEEDVMRVMTHPRAMICTDSSVARDSIAYHPRLRGSFPRVLGRYVREKKLVEPEEMIRKMTGLPAMVYGFDNKGRIAEGFDADLCIFDFEKIIDRAEYADCHKRAEGLNYVLIDGEIVVENGIYNGKRKGKVLSHRKQI